MTVKVSVVIPVYNAESFLPRCISSLVNQTLKDCEFIFVNDGSRDGSKAVIERFGCCDKRIRVISQQNGGVSHARNTGIRHARGEYIGFVDVDDYVAFDMFYNLYKAAVEEDCDMVASNFQVRQDGALIMAKYPFPTNKKLSRAYIREQVLPYMLRSDDFNTACTKLYRRELLASRGIVFPEGVKLGEDGMFNMAFLSVAESMRYLNYAGYHYCEVEGSATRNAAKTDYYQRVLEVYQAEPPSVYLEVMAPRDISRLKSIKLISNVLDNIHIYMNETSLPLRSRLRYIKGMVAHQAVRESLPLYWEEKKDALGSYHKLLLYLLRRRSLLGIYMLTGYSRYRNRNSGGKTNENHDVCS